eukprot:Skav226613  [mRNA]  locus=scaffold2041:198913:200169:- [translate_table: standard]
MAALNCHFAEALCLGIGEYQHEDDLPKADEDAKSMKDAFRDLGCCDVTLETRKEHLTKEGTTKLVSDFVLRTKHRMMIKEAATEQKPFLFVLFVASHGIQGHGKQLPLIVPADRTCSSQIEELIDLDKLFLNELEQVTLPQSNRGRCAVWIILDTCRSEPAASIGVQSPSSSVSQVECVAGCRGKACLGLPKHPPEFLWLLACGPGRFALDSNSLSSALVEKLQQDGISIRQACEEAGGVVKANSRGHQVPQLIQCSPIFSKICRARRRNPWFVGCGIAVGILMTLLRQACEEAGRVVKANSRGHQVPQLIQCSPIFSKICRARRRNRWFVGCGIAVGILMTLLQVFSVVKIAETARIAPVDDRPNMIYTALGEAAGSEIVSANYGIPRPMPSHFAQCFPSSGVLVSRVMDCFRHILR